MNFLNVAARGSTRPPKGGSVTRMTPSPFSSWRNVLQTFRAAWNRGKFLLQHGLDRGMWSIWEGSMYCALVSLWGRTVPHQYPKPYCPPVIPLNSPSFRTLKFLFGFLEKQNLFVCCLFKKHLTNLFFEMVKGLYFSMGNCLDPLREALRKSPCHALYMLLRFMSCALSPHSSHL